MRSFLIAIAAMTALSACQLGNTGVGGGVKINRISSAKRAEVQSRMLDAVNSLRQSSGVQQVRLNSQLSSAADMHARDMSAQNRPWNFGSDGSSPIDRARRAGYAGYYIGEAISETFESELETLSAWMAEPGTRRIILDPRATNMGLSWFQERNGKIWWVLEMGG